MRKLNYDEYMEKMRKQSLQLYVASDAHGGKPLRLARHVIRKKTSFYFCWTITVGRRLWPAGRSKSLARGGIA